MSAPVQDGQLPPAADQLAAPDAAAAPLDAAVAVPVPAEPDPWEQSDPWGGQATGLDQTQEVIQTVTAVVETPPGQVTQVEPNTTPAQTQPATGQQPAMPGGMTGPAGPPITYAPATPGGMTGPAGTVPMTEAAPGWTPYSGVPSNPNLGAGMNPYASIPHMHNMPQYNMPVAPHHCGVPPFGHPHVPGSGLYVGHPMGNFGHAVPPPYGVYQGHPTQPPFHGPCWPPQTGSWACVGGTTAQGSMPTSPQPSYMPQQQPNTASSQVNGASGSVRGATSGDPPPPDGGGDDDASSTAPTSEIRSMLRRRAKQEEYGHRPKSSLGSVRIEEFSGDRGRYLKWKRTIQAQQCLYGLESQELAMLIYLSTRREARDVLGLRTTPHHIIYRVRWFASFVESHG